MYLTKLEEWRHSSPNDEDTYRFEKFYVIASKRQRQIKYHK